MSRFYKRKILMMMVVVVVVVVVKCAKMRVFTKP